MDCVTIEQIEVSSESKVNEYLDLNWRKWEMKEKLDWIKCLKIRKNV